MKPLPTHTFKFEFLTPCFSGTAEGRNAQSSILRVPPIRGHVRQWHISLFGLDDANSVWGSTAGNGCGSKVGMALRAPPLASTDLDNVLPHKDRHRGSRVALPAGSCATLVLTRLPGCTPDHWEHAEKATKLWLLLGTLGLRSARAAGSVWPLDVPCENSWVPQDAASFASTLIKLGLSKTSVALIGESKGKDAVDLRTTASDTVSERAVFGAINDRAPSPTKFKVVRLGSGFCLAASAPHKPIVLGPGKTLPLIQRAEGLLNSKAQPARWTALGAWNLLIP